MKPFFSVVIPTYNRAGSLRETLDTVLAQTFTDFEVLVMDDGSKDDTAGMVAAIGDPRIRYEWAPNSGGPATPRNRGIEAASADWICFLDADDFWYPDKLQTMFRTITARPDVDLICHNENLFVRSTGRRTPSYYGPVEPDFYRVMLLLGNRVSTSAATVRRAFLNRHGLRFNQQPDYVIVEDYDLWLRIALNGGEFYFCQDILGDYVIADDNISSNLAKIRHNHRVLLRDHVYKWQRFEPDKDKLWREINATFLINESRAHFQRKEYMGGVNSLLQAFRTSALGSLRYLHAKSRKRRAVAQV